MIIQPKVSQPLECTHGYLFYHCPIIFFLLFNGYMFIKAEVQMYIKQTLGHSLVFLRLDVCVSSNKMNQIREMRGLWATFFFFNLF